MTCRRTVRSGVEIEFCPTDSHEFRYEAFLDGKRVASAEAHVRDDYYVAAGIVVYASESGRGRTRVGTRLYEEMMRDACARGLVLASDEIRSHFAEAFWRKQQSKGRATCRPGPGEVYVGPLRTLRRKYERGEVSEELFRAATKDLPVSPDGKYWPCVNWVVPKPCAHASLEGARKRGSARKRA